VTQLVVVDVGEEGEVCSLMVVNTLMRRRIFLRIRMPIMPTLMILRIISLAKRDPYNRSIPGALPDPVRDAIVEENVEQLLGNAREMSPKTT
jgi:hypothetical protein